MAIRDWPRRLKCKGPTLAIQRCTNHKLWNLLAKAPAHLREELAEDYRRMIYATSREGIEQTRVGFLRKWKLRCKAVSLVFIAAPVAIITGLMQAPAISNRLGWFGRTLHRQAARSIHFVLCWFLFFIIVHVTMVFVTGLLPNLNHMFAGINGSGPQGLKLFAVVLVILTVA
jgi:Prokaryotic cytochrome b561